MTEKRITDEFHVEISEIPFNDNRLTSKIPTYDGFAYKKGENKEECWAAINEAVVKDTSKQIDSILPIHLTPNQRLIPDDMLRIKGITEEEREQREKDLIDRYFTNHHYGVNPDEIKNMPFTYPTGFIDGKKSTIQMGDKTISFVELPQLDVTKHSSEREEPLTSQNHQLFLNTDNEKQELNELPINMKKYGYDPCTDTIVKISPSFVPIMTTCNK